METDFYEYSLYELIVTPKGKNTTIKRNLLVPSKDWVYCLNQYEIRNECKIEREVLIADKIEATSDHDFNYGAQ